MFLTIAVVVGCEEQLELKGQRYDCLLYPALPTSAFVLTLPDSAAPHTSPAIRMRGVAFYLLRSLEVKGQKISAEDYASGALEETEPISGYSSSYSRSNNCRSPLRFVNPLNR